MQTSTTALLTGLREFTVTDRQRPGVPGPGDVQIEVGAVGICGSDLAYFATGVAGGFAAIDFAASLKDGYMGILGHEAAGTVVAVGPDVTHVAVGDRVALEAGVPCRACAACLGGRYNLCAHVQFLGSYVNKYPGALTQVMNHPAAFCHRLPDCLSMEQGAMVEPLSVALSAMKRGDVRLGQRVVVTGAGPVGLLCMLAAKSAGATVVVADIVASKLELATRLGADAVVDMTMPPEAAVAAVHAATDGGADVAVECSGAASALEAGVRSTRSGGTVVVVANQKGASTAVPLQDLCRREVDLRGVYRYCNTYPSAIRLLAAGAIDVRQLVTHRFPLAATQEAFEVFAAGEAVKVLITVGDAV